MAATFLSDYVDWLVDHYRFNNDGYLQIPITYSMVQGDIRVEDDKTPATTNTTAFVAFNNRGKQTLQLSRTAASDTDQGKATLFQTFYTLSFNIYLYDILFQKLGKSPWELGLCRDLYGYEDTKIMSGSFVVEYDIGIYTIMADQIVNLFLYSPVTGKLDLKFDVKISSDSADHREFAVDLWDWLIDQQRKFNNPTKYVSLAALFSQECKESVEATYTEETADSYSISSVTYIADVTKTLKEQQTLLTFVNSPIDRLSRVSVFDTGTWANYPLGSSPAECVARYLGLPYNNKYATTDSANAGVMQFINAVEQDVMYAFVSDPLNANISYSDLRSIAQAVTSYTRVMAANICSAKKLPRSVVPYIAAKIEYHLFYTQTLPADIESALNTVLGYILQDYSINDSVANARAYYEKCREITSYFGSFYTTMGTNVERLGVNAANFARVMESYREYQRLFLEIAYVRELNQLAITAKSTGSIELLDKTKTIYPRLQSMVYLGMNSQSMICSDVTISISNKPTFRVSANYIKRLEIS